MTTYTVLQKQLGTLIDALDVEGVAAILSNPQNKTTLRAAPHPSVPIYSVLDAVEDDTKDIEKLVAITRILTSAKLEEKPSSGYNPLVHIAEDIPNERTLRIAEVLLESDPLQAIDQYSDGEHSGDTLMNLAIHHKNTPLVKLIQRIQPSSVALPDGRNVTPLYAAVRYENLELVDFFLENGAKQSIDVQDKKDGDTALHVAVMIRGNDAVRNTIVKRLIDAGAKKTLRNIVEETPHGLTYDIVGFPMELRASLKPYGDEPVIPPVKPHVPPAPAPKINAESYLPNALPIKGFETRALVIGSEVRPVYVTTLKKGTLLFRGVRNERQLRNDVMGMNVMDVTYDESGYEEGSVENPNAYCLGSHYTVYFYPFPFVDVTVGTFTNVVIYVLKNDVKVATYISPTPMARADRAIKAMPIVSCDKIYREELGCSAEGMEGREYDPCFEHKFISENIDIVGMIAMAGVDRTTFTRMTAIQGSTLNKMYGKYISAYTDSHSLAPGVPEIILHPRNERITETIAYSGVSSVTSLAQENTTFEETKDLTEWYRDPKNMASVPYIIYHLFRGRDESEIEKFMADITSPAGLNGEHAQIDKTTGFYVIRELADDVSNLLPSEEASRMSDSFPELIFTRATAVPGYVAPSTTAGRKRRTLRAKRKRD